MKPMDWEEEAIAIAVARFLREGDEVFLTDRHAFRLESLTAYSQRETSVLAKVRDRRTDECEEYVVEVRVRRKS